MTIEIKHQFESAKSDGGDTTIVQPSDWNDTHNIEQATDRILGRVTAGSGDTEELTKAQVRTFIGLGDDMAHLGMQVNGSCDVDQENSGAATTAATGYRIDQWEAGYASAGSLAWSIDQDTEAPNNYDNSLRVSITTAGSISAATEAYVRQKIEGYRVAKLGFGSSAASSLSIGFWVRSSKTGTYSVGIQNGAGNRSYVGEYTISVADVWEYKTISVSTGDIAGTWEKTTSAGLVLIWDLGSGPNYEATAGAWAGSDDRAVASGQNLIDTLNATWRITGLIVLPGDDLPTSDDAYRLRRSYDVELPICQRYWSQTEGHLRFYSGAPSLSFEAPVFWPVCMRVSPSTSVSGGITNNVTTNAVYNPSKTGGRFYLLSTSGGTDTYAVTVVVTADARM